MAQRSLATGLVLLLLLSTGGLALTTASATGARSNVCAGPSASTSLPNPAGYDNATYPGGEWVELVNEGSTSVDVRNWALVNEGARR